MCPSLEELEYDFEITQTEIEILRWLPNMKTIYAENFHLVDGEVEPVER